MTPAVDGDVAGDARRPGAVDDRPAADHQIVHGTPNYCRSLGPIPVRRWIRAGHAGLRRTNRNVFQYADHARTST